jgi:mRNA interferase RelE/StbE
LHRVRDVIEEVERAKYATEVSNLKKIEGSANYFRIRLGNYRIGIVLERDSAILVRFLNRKDIYKYFP